MTDTYDTMIRNFTNKYKYSNFRITKDFYFLTLYECFMFRLNQQILDLFLFDVILCAWDEI